MPIVARSRLKAEDQREARARTSGANNNDDDNQVRDMPSWVFKEESNREKPKNKDSKKKPAQIKKMITMLHKMSKSKKAPQKESVLLDQF